LIQSALELRLFLNFLSLRSSKAVAFSGSFFFKEKTNTAKGSSEAKQLSKIYGLKNRVFENNLNIRTKYRNFQFAENSVRIPRHKLK
jgi:hypothetical protein